jgi:deoxyribodipyrimidine photolyase
MVTLVWFTGSVRWLGENSTDMSLCIGLHLARLEFTPLREVPHMSSMNKCFKPEFTNLEWEYDETKFAALCEGKTGSPVVDAAMRQVNHDKWMHNRTRMIIASFFSKDLLIDWRRGERYFMETLIDGDFATNHGGFGFGSGIEVDPQPYFRSFNPLRQSVRFQMGSIFRSGCPSCGR